MCFGVITILWDIVEWRRIRSVNEMANSSGETLSDPLHWFWWLLLMQVLPLPLPLPSLCPLNPLQLLFCILLNIELPHAFNPPFALLRVSSSHKCCCERGRTRLLLFLFSVFIIRFYVNWIRERVCNKASCSRNAHVETVYSCSGFGIMVVFAQVFVYVCEW